MIYENRDGEVRIFGDEPRADGLPHTNFPFGRKRSFLPDIEERADRQSRSLRRDVQLFAITAKSASTQGGLR